MMDYSEIRASLEKYWEGQTSVEEEQQLKAFFNQRHEDLPSDLEQAADLFRFFSREADVSGAGVSFPTRMPLHAPFKEGQEKGWPPVLVVISRYWEYAAMALLIAGSALWFQVGGNPALVNHPAEDTYQTPEEAFAATQKALQFIAANLNKSKTEMQKLALFHEVTQQVAGHSEN